MAGRMSDPSRSVPQGMARIAAAFGLMLSIVAGAAALPKAPVDEPAKPELTSGGKFAARILLPMAEDDPAPVATGEALPAPLVVHASAAAWAATKRAAHAVAADVAPGLE